MTSQDKKEKKPKKVVHNQSDIVNAIINQPPSENDPFGSYTGKPENKYDVPTQDADDL